MSVPIPSRRPLVGRASAAAAVMALTLTAGGIATPSGSGALSESEWALTTLEADRAWGMSMGKGVTVAVIGTGVDAAHPDLRGRVVGGADFGDGASRNGTSDHGAEGEQGTHVAGIIAATGRNFRGDGMYGLAPEARVLPLRVYRNDKPAADATAKAIRYAARHGAQVINVSVSFTRPGKALQSAVDYAVKQMDAVVVAGAGDNGKDGNRPTYPASLPGVVAVSATDKKGAVWQASHHSRTVTLAAPGVGILTTARDGDYWTGDGTTYAAPWVAAGAALLRAEHPRWTSGQIVKKLTDTADRKSSSGRDPRYGFGIVAPAAALADRAAPSASASPSLTGQAADQSDRTAGASSSSDAAALVTVGAVAAVLVVLAVISVILVSRRRPPPGAD